MSAPDDFIPRRVVVIGICALKGGAKGASLNILNEDGSLGTDFALPRTKFATTPGTVYEVPMNPSADKMRVADKRYVGTWPNADDIAMWATRANVVAARERAEAMEKQGKTKALREAMKGLEPIKIAYAESDRWGRVIIEALVLQYLRNPL